MAWQLIYTSAPRLLEAGRSGFGTVARHRQISPLLVSAIERSSQFARLPGLDAGRVIYCHRIVAIAGGRFHVLSCIRDSGADYTGRTNHLAHHLVAEPREVAALGPRGASPADVLLGMSWLSAWYQAPRFLEAGDEIALTNFRPHTDGQWEQITGNANNAWLLANGEASRGAYLLYAPGTDLRLLFAESLRLAPDRLWQIPFTTALQPSDESSDFRWIGAEGDSPLRTQAESSSRPVLDLTRPETLPTPDVPANAAIAGIPRPSALGATTAKSAPAIRSAKQPALAKSSPILAPAKRGNAKWFIAGGVLVLMVAIAFGVIRQLNVGEKALHGRRDDLKKRIADLRIFSPQAADSFSRVSALHFSAADQIVTELERSADALRTVRFDKMRDGKSGDVLHVLAQAANLDDFAPELETFADRVREVENFHAKLAAIAAPGRAGYDALRHQREALENFAKETQATSAFSSALAELRADYERAEAMALLALLHPRDSPAQKMPPTEIALVKERLAAANPADEIAAKTFSKAKQLLKAWESVQSAPTDRVAENLAVALRAARGDWPEWLVQQAEATLAKSRGHSESAAPKTAPPFSAVPLYFFSDLNAIKDAQFPELENGPTFQLRTAPDAAPVPLIDPARAGSLRRQVPDPALFIAKDGGKNLAAGDGAKTLARPFVLLAKGAGGTDVLQLWIVSETDKPLLPKKSGGLSRHGNSLVLDPAKLDLPGTPKSRMNLRLPESALPARGRSEPLPVKDWTVDLAPLVAEVSRFKKQAEQQTKPLDAAGAPPGEEKTVRLAELKSAIEKNVRSEITKWSDVEQVRIERRESDETKRKAALKEHEAARRLRIEQALTDFGEESQPLAGQVGGCIKAFTREAAFEQRDLLFSAGGELCGDAVGTDVKLLAAACAKALAETRKAKKSITTSEMIARYHAGLGALESMILLISPETPELKTERAKAAGQRAARQEDLRRIDAHPLFSEAVPPGLYRLSVMADGAEIPLLEIEVSR